MNTRAGLSSSGFADESLFGDTTAERLRKMRMKEPVPSGPGLSSGTGKDVLAAAGSRTVGSARGGRGPVPSAADSGAPVVLPVSEFESIKLHALSSKSPRRAGNPDALGGSTAGGMAVSGSAFDYDAAAPPEEGHAGALAARAAASRQAAALARKEKIRALEAQRLAHVPKTSLELEEEAERAARRAAAQRMREEATDDAKLMNALKNYAVTVSIRDRQLAEKKERAAQEAIAERMRDVETELARLELLKRVHEREGATRTAAREAAKDVTRQMDERITAKQAAMAALRREADEAVAAMRAAEAAHRAKMEELQRRKVASLAEVLEANEEATRLKAERREREIAEDRRIEAVQREMDARKEALAAEAERARREREEAMFRVRGEAQRAMDTRSAIDELRARRAFEAGQRAERAREAERLRRTAAMVEDLKRERVAQVEAKQGRLAVEVEAEKAEFDRARRIQEEWIATEAAAAAAKEEANKRHLQSLLVQKVEKEAEAKARLAEERASGAVARREEEEKQAMLRSLRERKVAELLALGVDSKYTVQLAGFDPASAVKKDYKLGAKSTPKGAAAGAGAAGAGAGGATKKK